MDSLRLHSHCHVPGLALRQVLLRSDQPGVGEQSSVTLPETLDVPLVVDDLRERYNKSEQSRTDGNRREQTVLLSQSYVVVDEEADPRCRVVESRQSV